MNNHPYLKAYMAGIAVPTAFLLVAMTAFTIVRHVSDVPVPIERFIVFPLSGVPNVWGGWNMLYIALRPRRRLPIGIHGAIVPILAIPVAVMGARAIGVTFVTPGLIAIVIPVALIVYYLAWKYLVAFLNRVVGLP